jgi:hypothetical protein
VSSKIALYSGLLIPFSYVFLYVLGGALRAGYSHISHSVSELLSPDAPNKPLLASIQVFYALLHVTFGLGMLQVVTQSVSTAAWGPIGAWAIVGIGVATVGTAIFPQDAEGTPATTPGTIHKTLVFAVLIPASILSTLGLALWSRETGLLPGFDVYSYVTIGAIVVSGGVGGAAVKTRWAGLSERVAALITHQWLFVLAFRLLFE